MGTTATNQSRFPDGLEIFRAGKRRASNGEVYDITAADLAATVAAYDPGLHEAPLVIGHPESNHPAWGWVSGLTVEDGVLKSSHRQVDPAFAEYFAAGRVKKRSTAFYHPTDPENPKPGVYYPRHVGFLGAQPPAVKGLQDPSFSASGDTAFGLIHFSEPDQPDPSQELQERNAMTKELQDQLNAEKKATAAAEGKAAAEAQKAGETQTKLDEANRKLAQFQETQRNERHAGHVSFCEAQVKAGKLLPKDKAMAIATLDKLGEVAPVVEFSEGDAKRQLNPAQWLKDLIAGTAPQVDFSEHGGGGHGGERGAAKGMSDADIDKAAKAYAAKHRVSYAEAVSAVVEIPD